MADDPDAMWKPGYPGSASDDCGAGRPPIDDTAPAARGLPDSFHPAAGQRRQQRAARSPRAASLSPAAPAIAASDGPPPVVVGSAGDDAGWVVAEPAHVPPVSRRRRWPRVASALAAVAALGVAAVVVIVTLERDSSQRRPEPGEVRGADERRLPAEVDVLWSTVLPGTGNALASTAIVDGRDLVVVVVDDGSRNRSMIAGIDATSGVRRWRRSFSFAPPEVAILGVIDGVVLVEQRDLSGPRLMGLASVDGATLWVRESPGGAANSVLLGTDVVVNLSAAVNGLVTFVDPRTGEPVGDVLGEPLSTDLNGTWFFAWGSKIVSIDLADGWSEPVVLTEDRQTEGDMVMIDGRLLVADQRGRVVEITDGAGGTAIAGSEDLPRIASMFPAGGSSFVGLNEIEVFGAELAGDKIRVTWTRTASLRSFALTERGLVLSLSDTSVGFVDGADLIIVDGVTGDRLAGAGAVDDSGKLPLIVGDGFVTVTDGPGGTSRFGYDLDGTELWRLPVAGKVRVGDELVVVLDNTPSGFRLTAYGSAV